MIGVAKMIISVLLFASAAAMEIGLSMTGSGTAQFQPSTASLSAPETVSEIIISLSEVSSSVAAPTNSSAPKTTSAVINIVSEVSSSSASSTSLSPIIASPTVTDAPIYTHECNSDEGRNCDRLPEMPFWSGIIPGDLVYGFTPTAQQNPWSYFLSFTQSGQPSSALESASACSAAWYTNYTTWLATAPLTFSGAIPQTTVTTTLDAETVPYISYGSIITGTATVRFTETYTISGEIFTSTFTDEEYEFSSSVSTFIQTATTETLIYTSYTAAFYPSYDWKPQAPCCSGCTIYAGAIEVMYFPAATAAPGNKTSTQPSTVVDSTGFTFTSPSVYMALQTLAASDLCGQLGSVITSATTISFAQDQISTVPAYSSDGSLYTFYPFWSPTAYTAASFGSAPCTDVTTVTAADVFTATVTYNPCFPYISIPPQIQTADPLWATCTSRWQFLLYDPPYVISAGAGIGGFSSSPGATTAISINPTSSPQAEITSSSVASTLPTATPPTVSPTATSSSIHPASTENSTPVESTMSTSHVIPGNGQSPSLASAPAIVTIGSSIITANSASGFVIGSKTLTPGGEVTVGGTTISLASNGATIVIGSSTEAIINTPEYIVGSGSQTLKAGAPAITISGTLVSLQDDGSSVVLGGSTTEALSAFLESTTTNGLAGIIANIGGFGSSTIAVTTSSTGVSAFNATVFTGNAGKGEWGKVWIWGTMLGACIIVVGSL